MAEDHTILGGKVHIYKRPESPLWQSSTFLAGKNRRSTTKEESLSKAKEIAEDWYLQLRGKFRVGEIKDEKTFREVREQYLREYDIITHGQRNKQYVNGQHWRSSLQDFRCNSDVLYFMHDWISILTHSCPIPTPCRCAVSVPCASIRYAPMWAFSLLFKSASVRA